MALLVWGSLVPRAGHGQHQASGCLLALARGGEQIQATEAANQRSSDVMTSPQLQTAIAGKIVEACSEVVTVRFNFSGTDWQTMLFRGANGRVIRCTCGDAVRGTDWPL
jgi:hypothetical protein